MWPSPVRRDDAHWLFSESSEPKLIIGFYSLLIQMKNVSLFFSEFGLSSMNSEFKLPNISTDFFEKPVRVSWWTLSADEPVGPQWERGGPCRRGR